MQRFNLTKLQRGVVKWVVYSLLFLLVLTLQDVVFSRLPVFGARFHLIPILITCVCLAEGAESGGIFALCAGLYWALSGADLGYVSIVLLTFCGVGSALLRDHLLLDRLSTCLLCCLGTLLLHDTVIFLLHLFLGGVEWSRFYRVLLPGVLISMIFCPVFYALTRKIRKIGGLA